MVWAENFHVLAAEGQKSEDLAAPRLRQILSTLEAGLARTNGQGTSAADILAHLGWAHWLNQKIAYQEFGSAAEQGMRKALSLEPSSVYANAMLGNWLLQTGGSVIEAMRCFNVAVKSGKQRPLVRALQLGALTYNDSLGVRTKLIRTANQMRINSEPIDNFLKRRILSDYSPTHTEQELRETLAALPPDQAWATFQWLDDKEKGGTQQWQRDFIHATILELAGNHTEALAMFKTLQQKLKADVSGPAC